MLDVRAVTVYTESAWFDDDIDATPSVTSVPPDVQRIDGRISSELLNATLHSYCITSDSAVFSVAFVDDINDSIYTCITCQLMHFCAKRRKLLLIHLLVIIIRTRMLAINVSIITTVCCFDRRKPTVIAKCTLVNNVLPNQGCPETPAYDIFKYLILIANITMCPKNVPHLACYNLDKHQLILTIFGKNVMKNALKVTAIWR